MVQERRAAASVPLCNPHWLRYRQDVL